MQDSSYSIDRHPAFVRFLTWIQNSPTYHVSMLVATLLLLTSDFVFTPTSPTSFVLLIVVPYIIFAVWVIFLNISSGYLEEDEGDASSVVLTLVFCAVFCYALLIVHSVVVIRHFVDDVGLNRILCYLCITVMYLAVFRFPSMVLSWFTGSHKR